jgi:hypothetical protein
MPKITAQADVFRDWEAILGACTQNASLVPGVDELKTELEGLLAQARDLKIQQETLQGGRLAATQQLEKVLDTGLEVVRKIRAFAVVKLGSDNKQLAVFGVAVRRSRGARKEKSRPAPPPTVSPAPAAKESKEPKGDGNEKPLAG